MTTTATSRPLRGSVASSSVLLVVFAVGQLISPIFSGLFGGAFTTADRAGEPPITPAGYTFAIWGVIELLSLGYAIWALWWRKRSDPTLLDRLAVPLAVVFAGFSAWLVAAELEPNWATLAVFVVMILGLLRALSVALTERNAIAAWPRLGRWLLWGTLGLYTGWSSIAIWLNLTTGLAGSGVADHRPGRLLRAAGHPGRSDGHGGRRPPLDRGACCRTRPRWSGPWSARPSARRRRRARPGGGGHGRARGGRRDRRGAAAPEAATRRVREADRADSVDLEDGHRSAG